MPKKLTVMTLQKGRGASLPCHIHCLPIRCHTCLRTAPHLHLRRKFKPKDLVEKTVKKAFNKIGAVVVAVPLVLSASVASAQVQPNTHQVDVYAGALFGDDLTKSPVSGNTPELDDDVTFGARYTYQFLPQWAVQLSSGFTPTSVKGAPGGDIDLDLTTIDADLVYNFNLSPDGRWVGYLLGGAGYAFADLDRPIRGTVNGLPVSINDDDGFTANAGLGAKYFATDHIVVSLEGRYRYFDKLVDRLDDSLNGYETTLGVGWRF
jgi:opacity protein-like surface antigen